MTSLVTTLTLMMTFNAIVFDGVTTISPKGVKCLTSKVKVMSCLQRKWNATVVWNPEQIRSDSQCCLHLNAICGIKLLVREEVCEDKGYEEKCNQYKDCSEVKTYPMDKRCDSFKKYINCLNTPELNPQTPVVTVPNRSKDTKCDKIIDKVEECLNSKWKVSLEDTRSEVSLKKCCLGFNYICVTNQLVREEVCEETEKFKRRENKMKRKCNQYKDCSQVKTYPMDKRCDSFKKYTNCELKNRSHHISCGPLLVITSIAIIIVIQFLS